MKRITSPISTRNVINRCKNNCRFDNSFKLYSEALIPKIGVWFLKQCTCNLYASETMEGGQFVDKFLLGRRKKLSEGIK